MKWAGYLTILLLLLISIANAIAGCSQEKRYQVLSFLFEGVEKPGETSQLKLVVRHPRRPPPPVVSATPTPSIQVAVVRQEQGQEWFAQLLPRLPKDKSGKPDWVRALDENLISPKPGIDRKAKNQRPFNLDVDLVPKNQPAMKVLFSHKSHTEWLGCANCHPAQFKMKKGGDDIKMAQLYAGNSCGLCHGKVAFAVTTGCARCHLMMGKSK